MLKESWIYYFRSIPLVYCLVLFFAPFSVSAQNVTLTIHLRGVNQSNISLLALTENGTFKPLIEINGVNGGATTALVVEKQYLPGEFVLRFDYKENVTSTPYPSEKRILFWSADCSHCKEVIEGLYPWQQAPLIKSQLSVVAISLDETESEINSWQRLRENYEDWINLRAEAGVRSKVAADYFILSTPQMILLDAGTKKIIDLPGTIPKLKAIIQPEVITANKELQ